MAKLHHYHNQATYLQFNFYESMVIMTLECDNTTTVLAGTPADNMLMKLVQYWFLGYQVRAIAIMFGVVRFKVRAYVRYGYE